MKNEPLIIKSVAEKAANKHNTVYKSSVGHSC